VLSPVELLVIKMSDKGYRDEETLRELYNSGMKQSDIAQRFGVEQGTISDWMSKHGIETRDSTKMVHEVKRKQPPYFGTDMDGYERVENGFKDERYTVLVHRLLMVAEHGYDNVKDSVVHHKNGVKWDNRPENLELMDLAEHTSQHLTGEGCGNSKLTENDVKEIKKLLRDSNMAQYEIANKFDVSSSTISDIANRKRWGFVTIE